MAGLRERAVAASVAVLVTATTVLSGAAVGIRRPGLGRLSPGQRLGR